MATVPFDAGEREQLCVLLAELGPQAPTLLGGWTTLDLVAHLVLREHGRVAAPGLVIPGPWGRYAERRRIALKQRAFDDLVAIVRAGPPPGLFRVAWVRRVANLNEFYVHHEDVRRANGFGPRALSPGEEAALWRNVAGGSWFLARRLRGAGLLLAWAGTQQVVRARRGHPVARLTGPPGDLLLYLFGRREVAGVEVSGDPAAVDAVRRTPFGM